MKENQENKNDERYLHIFFCIYVKFYLNEFNCLCLIINRQYIIFIIILYLLTLKFLNLYAEMSVAKSISKS